MLLQSNWQLLGRHKFNREYNTSSWCHSLFRCVSLAGWVLSQLHFQQFCIIDFYFIMEIIIVETFLIPISFSAIKKKNSNLLKRQKKLVAQCFWKKWTWKHHFNPRFCVRESVHTCIILRVVIISIILLIWILGAVELHKTLYKPPPSPLLLQKEICLNSIIHCLCLQEFLDDFANAVNSQFGCLLVMGKVAVATERWCVAVHCFNYQFVL